MEQTTLSQGNTASFLEGRYRERLLIALKAAKMCVFEVDLIHQMYTFFENSEDIFGVCGDVILKDVARFSCLSAEEYQKAVSEYFTHPQDADVIDNAFEQILKGNPMTYHARMRAKNSDYIWCKVDVTPVLENGKPVRMVGVITDISDLKARTDSLERKVQIDTFTGLYRKKYCEQLIKDALVQRRNENFVLLFIDLDDFKNINDTLGHGFGDLVLKDMAQRLKDTFEEHDIIGRFGGDEFLVLTQHLPGDTNGLEQKISAVTRKGKYDVSASIGVAFYPQDADTYEELFRKADIALYYSKKKKACVTHFSDL